MVGFDFIEELNIFLGEVFSFGFFQKHNTGGLFGFGSNAQFKSASDKNVRNAKIFAHDGNVADDINRADIGGNDAKSSGALFDGLDNILDPSFEFFVLVQMSHQLQQLRSHCVVGERIGNG
jgi:hypothetical protein